MRIGEIVKQYRLEHGMSQRQLSAACGMSTGYISLLEADAPSAKNRKNIPSLSTLSRIASAMGITLDTLLSKLDDSEKVSLQKEDATGLCLSLDEINILHIFRALNDAGRASLMKSAQMHALMPEYQELSQPKAE